MIFNESEVGQGLLEYALVLVLIAVVVFSALALLGPSLGTAYSTIMNAVPF